jgi:hypothetical protein
MDLADEVVARLSRLALLNDGNLVLLVRDLVRSAVASAPSCLGVIITIGDEEPFYIIDDRLRGATAVVRASLRAQFAVSGPGEPARQIVLLAEQAGGFKDFAAATLPTSGFPDQMHVVVIDGDLDADIGPGDGHSPGDYPARVVDRAIGVLLDRGFGPPEALQELRARAQACGRSLPEQAALVLESLRKDPAQRRE